MSDDVPKGLILLEISMSFAIGPATRICKGTRSPDVGSVPLPWIAAGKRVDGNHASASRHHGGAALTLRDTALNEIDSDIN